MRARRNARRHLSADLLRNLRTVDERAEALLGPGLEHLASQCPECRRRLAEYLVARILERAGAGYDAAITRAKERIADLGRERAEAPARVADLMAAGSFPVALATLSASPRYQTWGVATYLLERAEAGLESAPREASTSALLATAVADQLPAEHYGGGAVATARAVAGAILATARVQAEGDVAGAEACLERASGVARAASDHSLVRAELALARMAIDLAEGNWQRAIRAQRQVEAQAAAGGLPGQRLRAYLYLGRAHRGAGESSRALGTFRLLAHTAAGQPLYRDLGRWGTLEAARTLLELGRAGEALGEVERVPAESFSEDEVVGRAVRRWLLGRALSQVGRVSEGAAALDAAWMALAQAGAWREGAAAMLDLVELHLTQGAGPLAEGVLSRTTILYRANGWPLWATREIFRLRSAAAGGDLEAGEVAAVRARLLRQVPGTAEPVH